jgi:hypothetical protein
MIGGSMIRLLKPSSNVENLEMIDLKKWYQRGIRGVLIDLDNTISPWRKNDITGEALDFFQRAAAEKIQVMLFTNAKAERAGQAAANAGIPYFPSATKPLPWRFQKAARSLGLKPNQTLMVGDQIFTDILGGNLAGCVTVLVPPLEENEYGGTKILRMMERMVGIHQKFRRNSK